MLGLWGATALLQSLHRPLRIQVRYSGNVKTLNMRVKAMHNVKRTVQTMKVVSASKYARAKKDLTVARPYGQGAKVFYDKMDVKPVAEAKTLLVVMSSDKGLCGGNHKHVAQHTMRQVAANPANTRILCVGLQCRNLLMSTHGERFEGVVWKVGRLPPTFLDASFITNIILNSEFKFAAGKVIFNESKAAGRYDTVDLPIFNARSLATAPGAGKYQMSDVRLQNYLEFSMNALLFFAMKEANTSEQSARMVAMDKATTTATKAITQLRIDLNKTRQQAITQELVEIVSGANAAAERAGK